MRSFQICLLICVLLLTGCPKQAAISHSVPQEPPQTLLPIHQEKLPGMADFFDFADGGKTFLLAGDHRFIYLYDTASLKKLETIKEVDGEDFFSVHGAGYIDDNTWYIATYYAYPNPDYKQGAPTYVHRNLTKSTVSIREINSSRELYQGDFYGKRAFVNKNHIGSGECLINWHTEENHRAYIIHPGEFSYQLTHNNLVISKDYRRDRYLFHNPIKQEKTIWDFGYGDSKLTLSPDANYALYRSSKGRCELWQVPNKERLGRCGNSRFWGEKNSRAVFQRDNQAFAVSDGNRISLYATQPFKKLTSLVLPNTVETLALNEGRLAAIDASGTLRVWDIRENKLLGEYIFNQYISHEGITNFMEFQPLGSRLVITYSGTEATKLVVFDLAQIQEAKSQP